ncbi:proteasome accessory factor PafA2 [Kineosporiaceae bacterium SCSIO 59966]|nr:proteasome accessory factor PafA2 [Kineosporiaceae bacterium SCSIO 59966]
MTVRRVMGIETEYGVSSPGRPEANPMVLSSQVVHAYAEPLGVRAGRARWDYEDEAPLRDARGWELTRGQADPTQLTDAPRFADQARRAGLGELVDEVEDPALANVVLTNGARLYVDHAHPEYSSPEVVGPRDAVRWDKAGERVMLAAVRRIAATPGLGPVNLYKNNTDNKGASYGTHENYLMNRATPFPDIVRGLIPFFVSRQVVTGAGRVGIGQDGAREGFQISQRADFFEVEVGLETTLKRPLVNTRDEPHAHADRYRRLHVIIGDANLSEISTYLKVGTTALVLDLIEARALPDLTVETPVAALHAVSHDPTLRELVTLHDGTRLTAVQLQWRYLEAARAWVDRQGGTDPETVDVLERWESVLTRLERDPMDLAGELDWVAKLRLLQGFRDREGLDWGSSRLQLIDLQYTDVRPEKGLYHRLVARGAMQRLLTDEEVDAAVSEPPEDTRAWFRGQCLARFGADVAAASWDSVIFDLPGRGPLQRVPMLEPTRGTREHVGALFERVGSASELVEALRGAPAGGPSSSPEDA